MTQAWQKAVRDRRGWESGDRLVVEERPDGVLLRRESARSPSRLEDVRGMLKWNGPDYSPAEVRSGAEQAVEQKFARLDETSSSYPDEAPR